MTEHKPAKVELPGSRFPESDPRDQAAANTTTFEDAGPGEPGYYNPPDPEFGVSHTASNEIRPPELVKKAEEIPDTRSPWDKKRQGETGTGTHAEDKDKSRGKSKGKSKADMTDEEYEEMTVPELRDLADERGVDVKSDARKDEIIEALKNG